MDTVDVHFESLQAGGDGVNAVYHSLLRTLDDLDSQLRPMLHSWTGEARSAYFIQKKQWDSSAQALGDILAGIGRAVHQAHDNYRDAEHHNAVAWS
jgi:WXG100 family type VII secretion target